VPSLIRYALPVPGKPPRVRMPHAAYGGATFSTAAASIHAVAQAGHA